MRHWVVLPLSAVDFGFRSEFVDCLDLLVDHCLIVSLAARYMGLLEACSGLDSYAFAS